MNNLATIEKISEILPHSNADKLLIAKVRGYNIIVPKDKYSVGDVVVLIHPDSILPSAPWAETFKKYAPKRIRAIKIRGEFSFGIIVSPNEVFTDFFIEDQFGDFTCSIGKEVGHLIGVVKYEAPQPQELNAKGNLPHGIFKTDEDRVQSLKYVPIGETSDITLKIDGCLDGSTVVETNCGQISMKEIFDGQMTFLKVKSYNEHSKKEEFRAILAATTSPIGAKKWIEIETEDGRILKLTENHEVFLPEMGCYRRADLLKEGDDLLLEN